MKTALITLAAACIVSGLKESGAETVKVMTYNIHHAEGVDGVIDLDRIVKVIKEFDPDVVFLQEMDRNLPRTGRRDFPALFAEKLGMPVFFEPNYCFDGGEYGNATLTRLPVASHHNTALPNPVSAEPRGYLTVTARWGDHTVDLINTHLGLNGQERLAQAEAIVAGLGENPVILAGDMNENLTAPALQRFTARLQDTLVNRTDATPGTVPAATPRRRIDYILASDGFETVSSAIVFNDTTKVASDHLPCVAVLRKTGESK